MSYSKNGKPKVIDVHHHYVPAEVFTLAADQDKNRLADLNQGKLSSITERLAEMDRGGIDIAVLSMPTLSEKGSEICKILNNGIARVVAEYPERFIGCVHLPVHQETTALDEARRGIEELGLGAIALATTHLGLTIDCQQLDPIWGYIESRKIPVILHPPLYPMGAELDYYLYRSIGRSFDTAKAIVRLINAVLPKYPDLILVLPHFGGSIPFTKGRVQMFYEPSEVNIPDKLRGCAKTQREREELGIDRLFEDYFGRLYFDCCGAGGWAEGLEMAVRVLGADRLVFGTDYPQEVKSVENMVEYIQLLDRLPAVSKEKILAGNASQIFRLA